MFCFSCYNISETKTAQIAPLNDESMEELLTSMNANCAMPILTAPVWNRMMRVPPRWTKQRPAYEEGIKEIDEAVKRCFSVDDPQETKRLLLLENDNRPDNAKKLEFIESTVAAIDQLDPKLLSAWYKLTRDAASQSLDEAFLAELRHGQTLPYL